MASMAVFILVMVRFRVVLIEAIDPPGSPKHVYMEQSASKSERVLRWI